MNNIIIKLWIVCDIHQVRCVKWVTNEGNKQKDIHAVKPMGS